METEAGYQERVSAVRMLRSGYSVAEVSQQHNKSQAWVYKWWRRFRERRNWHDLHDQSRAPKGKPRRISARVRQAVIHTRSELEVEACEPGKLSYIGSRAIRNRLKQQDVQPLPSLASIERILAAAGLTRRHQPVETKPVYPHLQPTQPHQLTQIDIVTRYLPGGACVSCFNAIDVISRYPTGKQSFSRRSSDAVTFAVQVGQELGISEYAQIDNEGCFSGGSTHPGVIGQLVRCLLYFGIQPVFSPFYLPESNGYVERFQQDYTANTWAKQEFLDLPSIASASDTFFALYRESCHHSALDDHSPAEVHASQPCLRVPGDFQLPKGKLPITEGQIHFIRIVHPDHTISIANITWSVPKLAANTGVWATLELAVGEKAWLWIFDAAPDAAQRNCLLKYPFPLKEPVLPLHSEFQKPVPLTEAARSLGADLFRSLILRRLANLFSTML